jgi:cytochrome c2
MKKPNRVVLAACIAGLMAGSALTWPLQAEDAKEDPIEKVMKAFHKAPKGTDPICKKALEGKASPEELKKLVAGYKVLTTAKPPKGDAASWKEKTTKLLAAAQDLEKGGADAAAKYKAAVDCKACHSVHKPN